MTQEPDLRWPLIAVFGAVALGLGAYFLPTTIRNAARRITPMAPLSRRREKILQILAAALPAVYRGSDTAQAARWTQLAPSYQPDNSTWRERLQAIGVNPDRYTTCGELPRYVASELGAKGGLERGGLAGLRDAAIAHGAWIPADGKRRPRPGDFLVLGGKDGSISHVNIAISTDGDTWRTADAGQKREGKEAADYVDRSYDERAGTLSGPIGSNAPPRLLVGWVDIDRYPIGGEMIA